LCLRGVYMKTYARNFDQTLSKNLEQFEKLKLTFLRETYDLY
jgi:hypothetical protein